MTGDDESDDELASRLGRVLARVDPVPGDVLAAARASKTWRTVDTELAALMYDSVLDSGEFAGVRGGGARMLTFTTAAVTVELEVIEGGRSVMGQVGGAAGAQVELCHADGSTPIEIDHIGHFSFRNVRPGPMSLRVSASDGAVTQTEWVVI